MGFEKVEQWYGQAISEEKSQIFFSHKVLGVTKMKIFYVFSFKDFAAKALFFRNSFVFSRNKSKEFCRIKERV